MSNVCCVCRASSKITSSKLYFIVCDRFLTTVSLKNSWQQKFTHKNYYSYPSYAVERPSTTTLSAGGVKLNTEHNNRGMRQVWKRVRTADAYVCIYTALCNCVRTWVFMCECVGFTMRKLVYGYICMYSYKF